MRVFRFKSKILNPGEDISLHLNCKVFLDSMQMLHGHLLTNIICMWDFYGSLASPLFSDYLEQIVSEKPSELLMKFDGGNLTFSTPDQRIVKYGQIEYPLTLSLDVDKSGQVLSVKSQDSNSLHKTFELGSAVKLTQLEFNNSWLSLTGEFLFTPSNW